MKKLLTVILTIILLTSINSFCTNEPSCFVKKFLQFQFPSENLYLLSTFTSNNETNFDIKAYGDFNNDLITDLALLQQNNDVQVYTWIQNITLYEKTAVIKLPDCIVQGIYLYDIDSDGNLDITVWGETAVGNQSCLIPYFQYQQNVFTKEKEQTMQKTTDPILVSYGINNGPQKVTGLLLYRNNKRVIAKYDNALQSYINIGWNNVFTNQAYQEIPFADPHWNTFVDITGDCRSDLIICDDGQNIQFWINNGSKFYLDSSKHIPNITSLSFADMDYDGGIDLVYTNENTINVKKNSKYLSEGDDFCCDTCHSVTFDFDTNMSYIVDPHGSTIPKGVLHINDINIDGYPDILMIINNQYEQTKPIVYQNNAGSSFSSFSLFNKKLTNQNFTGVIKSVSFLDILQNGILDIIVKVENSQSFSQTYAFYNNNLFQNYYFIKGYGTQSETQQDQKGTQLTGVSFFWVNSIGDNKRVAYIPQIIQTGYSALQLPYAYCGLGRANNYVQEFTLGLFGQSRSWTPIIPNSQLAVYVQGSDPKEWSVRVFVLPTQSLIYVVIISIVVLSLWGLALMILKYKAYKKREQINDQQFLH